MKFTRRLVYCGIAALGGYFLPCIIASSSAEASAVSAGSGYQIMPANTPVILTVHDTPAVPLFTMISTTGPLNIECTDVSLIGTTLGPGGGLTVPFSSENFSGCSDLEAPKDHVSIVGGGAWSMTLQNPPTSSIPTSIHVGAITAKMTNSADGACDVKASGRLTGTYDNARSFLLTEHGNSLDATSTGCEVPNEVWFGWSATYNQNVVETTS